MSSTNRFYTFSYHGASNDKLLIEQEWEKFVSGCSAPINVRPFMFHSWKRCLEQGIDPHLIQIPYSLGTDQIQEYVTSDPLFRMVKPLLIKLKQYAGNTGYLVTFSNPAGEMVYCDGDLSLKLKAEDIHLSPGANWSESSAGTNGIGTSLVTGLPLQVFASEHFCQEIHEWTCSAAPIRDPGTGKIAGIVDLSGFWTANDPRTLAAVIRTAREIESLLYNQLRIERLRLAQYFVELTHRTTLPLAVLDRAGRVVKASPILYEKGWISPEHSLEPPSFAKESLSSTTTWEMTDNLENKRWLFELSPYYYGGEAIGSVVHALPPEIRASPSLPDFRHFPTSPTLENNKAASEERTAAQPAPFYQSLFRHHPDAIFAYDLQGFLLEANPAAERLLGYDANELSSIAVCDLACPDSKELKRKAFAQAAGGMQQEFEAVFRHKQGHSIHAMVNSFPIIMNNEIIGVFETVRGIQPNHQQMAEDLKLTKEQLEFYLSNTEDAILVVDADFHIVKANQACERMFGWTEQELLGKEPPMVPGHLESENEDMRNHMLRSRNVIPYETVRQRKDGSLIHVNHCAAPLFDSKGSAAAYVLISRDITALHQMHDMLIESEKRLRTLINSMPDLVIFKDDQGKWLEANNTAIAALNLEMIDYQGMTDRELASCNPFYRETFIKCSLSDRRVWDKGSLIRFQEIIPHPGGRSMICDIIKVPIYHGDGRRKGLIVIGRDITELKQTEELLRKTEKLAVVGQLAAGIAHEIRNPLTTLKGFLSLLQSATTTTNIWYLEVMLSEIEQMESITDQLLTVARPQTIRMEKRNLEALIRQVSSFLYPLATMHNVQISVESDSSDLLVECEENQLKQVFINIIKNAIEAMPQGGQIAMKVRRSGDFVSVQVADSGCGIPQNRIARLGEPFYSLKEKGTGLGLMICYKIIKEHKGTLQIDSEVGRGTTVEIILPP